MKKRLAGNLAGSAIYSPSLVRFPAVNFQPLGATTPGWRATRHEPVHLVQSAGKHPVVLPVLAWPGGVLHESQRQAELPRKWGQTMLNKFGIVGEAAAVGRHSRSGRPGRHGSAGTAQRARPTAAWSLCRNLSRTPPQGPSTLKRIEAHRPRPTAPLS